MRRVVLLGAWMTVVTAAVAVMWYVSALDDGPLARSHPIPFEALMAWVAGTVAAVVWFVRDYASEE